MAQQGQHDQSAAIKAVDELQQDMKTLHANAETVEEQQAAVNASQHFPNTHHVVNLGNAFNDVANGQHGGKRKSKKSRKSKKFKKSKK